MPRRNIRRRTFLRPLLSFLSGTFRAAGSEYSGSRQICELLEGALLTTPKAKSVSLQSCRDFMLKPSLQEGGNTSEVVMAIPMFSESFRSEGAGFSSYVIALTERGRKSSPLGLDNKVGPLILMVPLRIAAEVFFDRSGDCRIGTVPAATAPGEGVPLRLMAAGDDPNGILAVSFSPGGFGQFLKMKTTGCEDLYEAFLSFLEQGLTSTSFDIPLRSPFGCCTRVRTR